MTTTQTQADAPAASGGLHRVIGWQNAFWLASGVPALVLFSIGGIAATIGNLSWVVWIVSVLFGFIQAFTYAEIAGLFPNKSGGASIYGATAWVRYSKVIAPLSVWCNWLAWTPVLAIGAGLGAGYVLSSFFSPDALINTWEIQLLSLNFINEGLALRINSTFVVGTIILLAVFGIQHRGISNTAKIQLIMGLVVIIPLLLVGIVPFLTGSVAQANLVPLIPSSGAWDREGWTLLLGGLFIAAWSAYAFETAVCYTSEFRNPKTDTVRAILSAGVLCIIIYTLVPLTFQGVLGVDTMLEPGIVDGSAVAGVMASMVGGSGGFVVVFMVVMLFLALTLAIMTSMAGSSRTLYQGAVDGWLPKYLSHSNEHGAPTRAMWTDLSFNLVLLMMNDYLFILAVSNCCYLVFNFLNLNAGWIHRIDNAHVERPWRAPTVMLWLGGILSLINAVLLGAGANVWGEGTLRSAIIAIALIIPVFAFRHYVQDKGRFPDRMLEDLGISGHEPMQRKAGYKPYLVLLAGLVVVVVANQVFYL